LRILCETGLALLPNARYHLGGIIGDTSTGLALHPHVRGLAIDAREGSFHGLPEPVRGARPARGHLHRQQPAPSLPPQRSYQGLLEIDCPMHDGDALLTACGRICMHKKKINISTVMAGQRLGLKEVDDGMWVVAFMTYGLGYIDLEQKTLQPIDNPFGAKVLPMS
jgi:hypothetical protein